MRCSRSALVALALAGCGEDTRRECPDAVLTYETFGGPFLISWCRGCHSRDVPADTRQRAPLDVNFDTERDVWRHAARIAVRAGPGGTMPPVGGPSPDERALLIEWIGCGTP